jgi:hypothetical protein
MMPNKCNFLINYTPLVKIHAAAEIGAEANVAKKQL